MIPHFVRYVLLGLISGSLITVVLATKVCGTNLVTYDSEKTGGNIGIIGYAACDEVCVSRNPVCGSDARTYYNVCHLILALRRGENITPRHSGHCGITPEYISQFRRPTDNNKESLFFRLPSLEDQPSRRAESMKESAFFWLPLSRRAEDIKEREDGKDNITEGFFLLPSALKDALRTSAVKQNASLNAENNVNPNISLNAELVFRNENKSYTIVIKDNKLEYTNSTDIQKGSNELQVDKSQRRNPVEAARGERKKVEFKLPNKSLNTSNNNLKKVKDKIIFDALTRDTKKDLKRTKNIGRKGERISDVALDNLKLELKFNFPKGINLGLFKKLEQLQGK